jgi:peptidoglycan-associated lipoprotein
MRLRSYTPASLLGLLVLAILAVSCGPRDTAPPVRTIPPPPPPAAARPTATLTASSTFVQRGETVTLNWSTTDATNVTLSPGIGAVEARGSRQVSPETSTTYVLTATGPGGSFDTSVRITVGAPEVPAPPVAPATVEDLFRENVEDAYFDFDRADIRTDARQALARTAEFLRAYSQVRILVEGHCDERGSTEYNLALGDRRAEAVRQFLISLGIDPGRIDTVSYGKERPFCTQSDESCWQQNRRGHIVFAGTR